MHLRNWKIPGIGAWAWAAACLLMFSACAHRDEARVALEDAQQAMGSVKAPTLRFTGKGSGASLGQSWKAGMAWPQVEITSITRSYDYVRGAYQQVQVRRRTEGIGGDASLPQDEITRFHDLWTSPHGILQAGLRNAATLSREGDRRVISFVEQGRFRAHVWINAENLVERIDTVRPDSFAGDLASVILYSGYRDHFGVKFPTRIREVTGGFPVMDIQVGEVGPVSSPISMAMAEVPDTVTSERMADGVWMLGGDKLQSVLVEMQDHAILIESPLGDSRARALLAESKRLLPAKPVRYVIATHHHFKNAAGLRAMAAEGVTLVVAEPTRTWFQGMLARPATVAPDALAKSGRIPEWVAVNGQKAFVDRKREVDVFVTEDSPHAQSSMLIWLPRERLLVQADASAVQLRAARPDAAADGLRESIRRLQLEPARIVSLDAAESSVP